MLPVAPLFALAARASTVTVDGATFETLRGPDPVRDVSAPPTPWAATRTIVLTPEPDGTRLRATWTIDAPAKGWFDDALAGSTVRVEAVTIDGRPAAIASGPTGTRLTAEVVGRATVVLDGFVDGASFALMPAVRGTIVAAGTDRRLRVDGAIAVSGMWLDARRDLSFALVDPSPVAYKPPLFVAEVAQGLTVRDGDVEGHATVRWLVRQGELASALSVGVRGAGRDVTVSGDNVRSWRWSGDALVIEPERPVRDAFAVDLAWSVPLPAGDVATVAVPELAPEGAFRVEASLLIARDDALEVVPELSGYAPIPASTLSDAALITGTPTSAWLGQGTGTLSVLRVVPIEQPAVLVDVAAHTLATNDEGRVLMRGYFTVRNERAASLRVVPPDGVRLVGVQVSGRPVTLGRDDGPGLLVPLPRSVETVDGLLSFPIEVVAFGTLAAWDGREERDVPLLRVDAPVAVQRVTLHLPPGFASRADVGESGVVEDFTEGETLSYGLAVGDVAAAAVDAGFQDALDAWMRNDFDEAQTKLDELRALGGDNENVKKLQSNLDVVDVDEEIGVAEAGEDTAVARRVKDMALARATDDVQRREALIEEGRDAELSGDYEKAAQSYGSARDLGERLAGLEQTESATLRGSNASVEEQIAVVETKVEALKERVFRSTATLELLEDLVVEGAVAPPKVELPPEPVEAKPPPAPDPKTGVSGSIERLATATDDEKRAYAQVALDEMRSIELRMRRTGEAAPECVTERLPLAQSLLAVSGIAQTNMLRWLTEANASRASTEFRKVAIALSTMRTLVSEAERCSSGDLATDDRTTLSVQYSSDDGMSSGPRLRFGRAKQAPEAVSAPEPMPALTLGADEHDEPVVSAQSLSVVVPDLGETVRFQAVLLPPDAAPTVHVRAREERR